MNPTINGRKSAPNPTVSVMTIELGGNSYELLFDLNCFAAFEEVTGRFFTDVLFEIQEASNTGNVVRKIPLKLIRAFLWAACHSYDRDGEPQWPLTIGQLGRLIDINNVAEIMPTLLRGVAENRPAAPAKEVDEGEHPFAGEPSPKPRAGNGGAGFGPSDDSILDSLERTSTD